MKIGGSILAVLVAAACLSGSASAEEFGNWTVGGGQGYVEHIVRNGPGNTFNISCDEGATPDGETKRTSIFIEIIGKEPPPNSQVQVFLDGQPVQLSTDARGTIGTNCHSCSDEFAYLWAKARKSKQLIVSLSDGRTATFRLNGAAKALPAKHCTTGFES
jgi:hypothetical protein